LQNLVEGRKLIHERLVKMDAERDAERETHQPPTCLKHDDIEDKHAGGEEKSPIHVAPNAFMHARQMYTTNVYLREISGRIDGVNARLDWMQREIELARRRAEKDKVERADSQDAVEARVQGMRREMRVLGEKVERLLALAERRAV